MRSCCCIGMLLCLIACIESTNKAENAVFENPQSIDSELLVERLSIHMVSNSDTSLLAKETNTIIDHCIQKGLDVKWMQNMAVQVIAKGNGPNLSWGDPVRIHYEGRFLNGEIFDSSISRSKPLKTYVGKFIESWNEALTFVGEGGELFIVSPSSKAYGPTGFKNIVPPNEILVFQIKVLPFITE